MSDLTKTKKQKLIYVEIIRIIAIVCVIFNHTNRRGYVHFTCYEPGTFPYWFFMLFSVLCGISVPLFFMISGMLLLGKDEPISVVWKKRILKHAVILVVFSVFFYLWNIRFDLGCFSFKELLRLLYSDGVITPYWFLYAYLSYLIILPFLRKFVKNLNEKDYLYLIGIYLVFYTIISVFQYRLSGGLVKINGNLTPYSLLNMTVFYPVIGFYFGRILKKVTKKHLLIALAGFLLSIVITCYMTGYMIVTTGNMAEGSVNQFYESSRPFQAIFIFLAVRKIFENRNIPAVLEKIIINAGSCVFGIYLIEQAVREMFYFIYDAMCTKINSFFAILIYVLFVFIFCWALVAVFNIVRDLIRNLFAGKKKNAA